MPIPGANPMHELVLPMHVAHLRKNGILADVPASAFPLVLEIGASDRNTLDVELLPKLPTSAFLVTCEPLVDKYARGLARDSLGSGDSWQGLGRHHPRGLLLPLAVGPMKGGPAAPMAMDASSGDRPAFLGEQQTFLVSQNAGCSSLADRAGRAPRSPRAGGEPALHTFGWQCGPNKEARRVWVVPLEQLLRWVGQTVHMVKIDAQGLDLRVIESAGPLLSRVERFSLEVVADECKPLYEGQPHCSAVVAAAARLGFAPVLPFACRLPDELRSRDAGSNKVGSARVKHGWCEMDVLFIANGVSADAHPEFLRYHEVGPHACTEKYESTAESRSWRLGAADLPEGKVLAAFNHPHTGSYFVGSRYPKQTGRWRTGSKASRYMVTAPVSTLAGRAVMCPASCFWRPEGADVDAKRNVTLYGGRCPW